MQYFYYIALAAHNIIKQNYKDCIKWLQIKIKDYLFKKKMTLQKNLNNGSNDFVFS